MDSSELMIVIYLSSEGSDGRGGEVIRRTMRGEPILAFKKEGVKVSRYVADCLKEAGAKIEVFATFEDMEPSIRAALAQVSDPVEQFALI